MPKPPSAPTRALGSFLKIIPLVSLETSLTGKEGKEGGKERSRRVGWDLFSEHLLCVRSDLYHTPEARDHSPFVNVEPELTDLMSFVSTSQQM